MTQYKIVRFYKDGSDSEVINDGLTRAEAQAHCSDPSTSTEEYFDGFDEERYEGEYQGYTNYATWVVDLHISNDYVAYNMWQRVGSFYDEPHLVREFVEDIIPPTVLEGIVHDFGKYWDMDDVDWTELLATWNED